MTLRACKSRTLGGQRSHAEWWHAAALRMISNGSICQSAFNLDPRSACKTDPLKWHGGGCPGSQ